VAGTSTLLVVALLVAVSLPYVRMASTAATSCPDDRRGRRRLRARQAEATAVLQRRLARA
jgi:hypothetical protein